MCVQDAPSLVRGNGFDEVKNRERAQKTLRLPELRSQSELDIAVPRSTMFSRLCHALQRSRVAGLASPRPSVGRSGQFDA
jgi:hypothetical protein